MNRRDVVTMITGASMLCRNVALAKDEEGGPDAAPRWKFLGDDDSLRSTIQESTQVLLVCVYQTSLDRVKPPFAEVLLRCTVVQALKGVHRLGDRITIRFLTDSLPDDDAKRTKFIEDAAVKNLGSLKMAFLLGAKADDYSCEWLDVPAFDPDMLSFATKHCK